MIGTASKLKMKIAFLRLFFFLYFRYKFISKFNAQYTSEIEIIGKMYCFI